MKKIISLPCIVLIIFSLSGIVFAEDSIKDSNYSIDLEIKNKVERFLNYYYASLSGIENENYYDLCLKNENTDFFKQFIEYDTKAKKWLMNRLILTI